MQIRNHLLLSALVAAIGGLFSATEVRPQLFTPFTGPPPRTCNLGTTVLIEAGPNSGLGLAPEFPRTVTCPGPDCPLAFLGTGQFQRWDYRWTYFGVNPSHALVSVASDREVLFASPSASVAPPGIGDSTTKAGQNAFEAAFLRFNASASTFNASYLTNTGFSPRIATAGATAGKFSGFCPLAGLGTTSLEPNQAVADLQTFQVTGCTVAFSVTPNGKVIPGTIQITEGATNCTTEETNQPITVDGKPIVFVGPVQFTQPGSCQYSWTNTFGGRSTVSCSTCCINNSTGKCVLQSSLASPSTQCKIGTYP